jgi:signal transduction histidine kinase
MTLTMDDFRQVPVRYYVLAVLSALLLLAGQVATPLPDYPSYAEEVAAFLAATARLGGVLLVLAPLLALRWVVGATVVAALPMLQVVFGEHIWPFTAFCSLVAVALVGTWRRPRLALVPAALALGYVVVLVTGHTTMVMPYGALIFVDFRSIVERLTLVGMYTVATAVLYAAALWLRASALAGRQEAALAARTAQVEEQAAVVGERARLARDLHDVVAHHVSLIAVRAETAPYTHPDMPAESRLVLGDIAADARTALEELRGVLGVLRRSDDRDPDRSPQPTLEDVAGLVTRARSAGDTVELVCRLDQRVSPATGYVGFRVVQEALTNARRHAPGQPVGIELDDAGAELRVSVVNPLPPKPPSGAGGGRGLAGMRERVEALGGTLETGVRGADFVVLASLPKGDG